MRRLDEKASLSSIFSGLSRKISSNRLKARAGSSSRHSGSCSSTWLPSCHCLLLLALRGGTPTLKKLSGNPQNKALGGLVHNIASAFRLRVFTARRLDVRFERQLDVLRHLGRRLALGRQARCRHPTLWRGGRFSQAARPVELAVAFGMQVAQSADGGAPSDRGHNLVGFPEGHRPIGTIVVSE